MVKIPIKAESNSNNLSFNFKSLLKQLKKVNKDNNKLDYLNISAACMIPYEIVGLSASGKELANPDTLNAILTIRMKIKSE